MLDSGVILARLEMHMASIKRLGVKNIGLFGSFVRNEQTENSDIDLLVEFKSGKKTFNNYMELKFLLEDLLERPVDLVIAEAVKPVLKDKIEGSVRYAQGL